MVLLVSDNPAKCGKDFVIHLPLCICEYLSITETMKEFFYDLVEGGVVSRYFLTLVTPTRPAFLSLTSRPQDFFRLGALVLAVGQAVLIS